MGEKQPFGDLVATIRKEKSLSQKELAKEIKKDDGGPITPQYLNDIEHGRRNPPSREMVEQIAKALGLSAEALYGLRMVATMPDQFANVEKSDLELIGVAYRSAYQKVRNGKIGKK